MTIKESEISEEILERLKNEVFIYPTDTIYGIGCDATNEKLVDEIREIKNRDDKPMSIIAPSKEWIIENCVCDKELVDKYLPGPYTLLLEKKNKDFLSGVSATGLLGVRIPDNSFTSVLQKLEMPIVTTSVNLSGESFANSVAEVNPIISSRVDLIIDAGELSGVPSTLVKDGEEISRK